MYKFYVIDKLMIMYCTVQVTFSDTTLKVFEGKIFPNSSCWVWSHRVCIVDSTSTGVMLTAEACHFVSNCSWARHASVGVCSTDVTVSALGTGPPWLAGVPVFSEAGTNGFWVVSGTTASCCGFADGSNTLKDNYESPNLARCIRWLRSTRYR